METSFGNDLVQVTSFDMTCMIKLKFKPLQVQFWIAMNSFQGSIFSNKDVIRLEAIATGNKKLLVLQCFHVWAVGITIRPVREAVWEMPRIVRVIRFILFVKRMGDLQVQLHRRDLHPPKHAASIRSSFCVTCSLPHRPPHIGCAQGNDS